SASDDFGLGEVALVVERGGKPTGTRLTLAGAAGQRDAGGRHRLQLKPLALVAGEQLSVWIEAKDNDTVSGPKPGVSRTLRLRIRAQSTRHDELVAKLEQLFEDMTVTLDSALTAVR